MANIVPDRLTRRDGLTSAGLRHPCQRCPTSIPSDRTLCHFCRRTDELAAQGKVKDCLRCRRSLPVDNFAGLGRYRVCDDCRWQHSMTSEESAESKRLSRREWKARNLRRDRLRERKVA
jgi:hypothetical protein